ncbi:hypothetical protein J2W55_003099 [Mucilaginibacter pocheonensis]|uniref:Uncharacterized protein n=1 Tax=Mucilaginibacter pocheonensis TaxID=398050 RepID=A0ABU1TEG1_9SPHI|nr:hypothetical protein [Mucilaginibacter pocheonensis]
MVPGLNNDSQRKLKMESNEMIWDFGCSISNLLTYKGI